MWRMPARAASLGLRGLSRRARLLFDSQFATLEPPDGEPNVIVIPADAGLDAAIPKLAA
jgi:gluconate kinase